MGAKVGIATTDAEYGIPKDVPLVGPDGKEVLVPSEYYHQALTEGGFQLPVTGPDGARVGVAAGDYEKALKSGYKPTAEISAYHQGMEAKKYDNPLAAGTAGFLRPITLGLSDVAGVATGLTSGKELKGWKEHNATATTVGEVGGMAASILAPGLGGVSGLGAAAKVGEGALAGAEALGIAGGETLLKRLAGKAIAGAAEGGVFGLGNVVSEAAMGDPDLNAQKVISEVGLGALLGGAAGGLGGLIGEGAGALKGKLAESKGSLEAFRNMRSVKATGAIQSDMSKLSDERIQQIGKDLYESGAIKPGANAREILEATKKGAKEQWTRVESALSKADEATGGEAFSITRVASRARNEVLAKIADDPALAGDARKLKRMIEGYGDLAGREGEPVGISFARAHELESNLRKSINPVTATAAEKDAISELRGIFREELGSQLGKAVGPEVSAEFEDAMQKYGSFAEAKKWGIKGIKRMEGNNFFSLNDRLSAGFMGAISGGPMGILSGAASALGSRLARERGSSLIANLAGKIAESPVMNTVAEHFASALKRGAPDALGAFAPEMANAAARGPREALATHMHLAETSTAYRQAAALAGIPGETAEAAHLAMEKAHGLTGLQHALDGHDDAVEKLVEKALHKGGDTAVEVAQEKAHEHASHVLKSQSFGSKRMRRDAKSAHEQHQEEITQLAGDPSGLADRVAANLGDLGKHAPTTAAAATATASRAVTFLASKVAKPPPGGPLAPEWHASPAEIAKFNRYYAVVLDPQIIIKQATEGTLTPEAVEAAKTVYPQWYESIQKDIIDRLTDKPKGVPYSQRVQLGLLAGIDVDGTLNAASIQRSQAVYKGPSAKSPEDQAGGGGAPKSGAQHLSIAKRSMTPMDAASSRGE